MSFNPNAFKRLPDFLHAVAAQFPEKMAIKEICDNGVHKLITFADLVKRSKQDAENLTKLGFQPGDRIALLEENGIEWIVTFFAVLELGATLVIIDPRLETSDFENLITLSDPQLIISAEKLSQKIPSTILEKITCLNPETGSLIGTQKEKPFNKDADLDAALILFTSGTSSAFKAVVLDHTAMLHSIEKNLNGHNIQSSDNYLTILPLSHIYGTVVLLTALSQGASTSLLKKPQSDLIVQTMQAEKTTIFPAVPRVLELFYAKISEKFDGKLVFKRLVKIAGKVRAATGINIGKYLFGPIHQAFGGCMNFFSGGASLSPEVHQQFHSLGFTVIQGYGLTETAAMVIGTTPAKTAVGNCGRALPGVELKIDPVDGQSSGEICIRSPTLMKSYFRDPEATQEVLKEGWFHSGDLGYLDAKGNLFITGRLKEIIVTSSGQKAMPMDIEERYREIPGVRELAIVGMPSSDGKGEEIHAAVVAVEDPALSTNSILDKIKLAIAKVSERVPSHLRIQQFHLVQALPKTLTMKVKRDQLKEMLKQRVELIVDEQANGGLYDETTKQLFDIIFKVCKQNDKPCKRLHPNMSFELDLNFDSLTSLELAYAIEKHFNVQLSEGMPIRTIDDADNQIRKLKSNNS